MTFGRPEEEWEDAGTTNTSVLSQAGVKGLNWDATSPELRNWFNLHVFVLWGRGADTVAIRKQKNQNSTKKRPCDLRVHVYFNTNEWTEEWCNTDMSKQGLTLCFYPPHPSIHTRSTILPIKLGRRLSRREASTHPPVSVEAA